MTCPDWKAVIDRRDAAAAPSSHASGSADPGDPGEWSGALRHLDSGCQRCRRQAVAADPTLIFRRLPVPANGPAEALAQLASDREAAEVEAVRRVVTAMRTRSELERLDLHPRSGLRRMRRWAAAATLAAAALSTGSTRLQLGELERNLGLPATPADHIDRAGLGAAATAAGAATEATRHRVAPGGVSAVLASSGTPLDGLSLHGSRVYDFSDPHFHVTMIVNAKFDV